MAIPARELRALIAGLDDDTILCGPQGDAARILIDPVFAGRRADHLADLAADMGWRGEALHEGLARTLQSLPLAGAPEGFRFHPLTQDGWSHGLIAVSDEASPRLAGFYAGCTLWVEPEMRGRGLGRALVGPWPCACRIKAGAGWCSAGLGSRQAWLQPRRCCLPPCGAARSAA